jgi:hypothetical protein
MISFMAAFWLEDQFWSESCYKAHDPMRTVQAQKDR